MYCLGTTVVPQYYSFPWNVYPTNIIQPSTTTSASSQARRPLTPSSAAVAAAVSSEAAVAANSITAAAHPGQYQMIPYYDQGGSVMMRAGLSNGTAMRLLSPAPVLVNPNTPGWHICCFYLLLLSSWHHLHSIILLLYSFVTADFSSSLSFNNTFCNASLYKITIKITTNVGTMCALLGLTLLLLLLCFGDGCFYYFVNTEKLREFAI